MKERVVNFPQNAPYGTEYYEHGRTWEFVAPGMWKSIAGEGGAGTGAGMVISPTEPADPVTGMQWLDSTTGLVFIWDDDKWIEFPHGFNGLEEAPEDNLIYGRQDGQWVEVSVSGGSVDWIDIENKPVEIKNLAKENAGKVSMISGGNY